MKRIQSPRHMETRISEYIYVYVFVCVCVGYVCILALSLPITAVLRETMLLLKPPQTSALPSIVTFKVNKTYIPCGTSVHAYIKPLQLQCVLLHT